MEQPAEIPGSYGKELQACLACRLVKTSEQFFTSGCENCEEVLQMAGDRERVLDCTTHSFQGLISVVDPKTSWAARWLHLRNFVSGVYALSIEADIPQHIEDVLNDAQVTYHRYHRQAQ